MFTRLNTSDFHPENLLNFCVFRFLEKNEPLTYDIKSGEP